MLSKKCVLSHEAGASSIALLELYTGRPDRMKSFASPSFFRVFDLLLSSTNPGLKLSRWSIEGVECERDRHSFNSPKYGLTIEVFTYCPFMARG